MALFAAELDVNSTCVTCRINCCLEYYLLVRLDLVIGMALMILLHCTVGDGKWTQSSSYSACHIAYTDSSYASW